MRNPEHIGDGVYVHWNGYAIELRVNDHRNEVAVELDTQVMAALLRFWECAKAGDIQPNPNA